MHRICCAAAILAASVTAISAQEEADPARGADLAEACAACHGQEGVSVEPDVPNLAAQKEQYLASQLRAFRAGTRPSPFMQAIAASLSDQDIADLAAHFSGLPGAEPGAAGEGIAGLDGSRVVFPSNFDNRMVRYHVIDFPDRGQVRHYWVPASAAEAAKAGRPLPSGTLILAEVYKARLGPDGEPVKGEDGHFEAGELAFYTAMQKIAGAGGQVPGIYRNGDWRYAVFDADRSRRSINEAKCLACHKPESERDYVFTLEQIAAAAP